MPRIGALAQLLEAAARGSNAWACRSSQVVPGSQELLIRWLSTVQHAQTQITSVPSCASQQHYAALGRRLHGARGFTSATTSAATGSSEQPAASIPEAAGTSSAPGEQQAGGASEHELGSSSQPRVLDAMQQELLGILSQPLPLGSKHNRALNDKVVQLGGAYFLDPNLTLRSTMRAFMVIKQVLASNGHVCIVNNNPTFGPLMRHAAQHCVNSNVWWFMDSYTPGRVREQPASLMTPQCQPARALLAKRQLSLVNLHCPTPDILDQPLPTLSTIDKWRLWSYRGPRDSGIRGRPLLREVVATEQASARLLLPGAGNQKASPTLIVLLDLSHGLELLEDAREAGILTASVVNAHSPLDGITYPIYAAEAHPAYTHFFLNWLLKIVNLPPR